MTTVQIQLLLIYLGYNPGNPDGILGKQTEAAIRAFQATEKLDQDGIAGKNTQQMLKDAVYNDRFKPVDKPSQVVPETGTWWDDIKYFSKNEPYIACSCGRCGGFPVEPMEKLMRLADKVREQAGTAMIPSSTVRCSKHNAEVGGVSNSRHLLGKAMDFRILGWSSEKTLSLVKKQSGVRYAYAINNTYVHMDIE